MAEPKFCFKHPTYIAKRRCFQCRRPLCPNCQIKLDHHLFCSTQCHADHTASIPLQTRPRYTRYALYASSLLLVASLVYFALLADAFYSGGNQDTQPALSALTPSLPVATETVADEIEIQRPLNGMKSLSQIIAIEGKAPQNA